MNQNPCPICEQLHADVVCPRNKTMTTEQWVPALDVYRSAEEMKAAQGRGGRFKQRGVERHMRFIDNRNSYTYLIGSDPQEPVNKHTKDQPMQTEQWVPALDVYASADEMRWAQERGGKFKWNGDKCRSDFVSELADYTYLLGSDPKEPVNKHTKEQPMQTEPDRMTYLIDCARQVLDGKTLQHKWDGWVWVVEESIQDALTSITVAMRDKTLQVRIKPEPVVSEPIYFRIDINGKPTQIGIARSCIDTHKAIFTNDDGKLSATIEELVKC